MSSLPLFGSTCLVDGVYILLEEIASAQLSRVFPGMAQSALKEVVLFAEIIKRRGSEVAPSEVRILALALRVGVLCKGFYISGYQRTSEARF